MKSAATANSKPSGSNEAAAVRDNPDKQHLFVDNGSLVATGARSMSWEYRYTLNVVIEDFSGDQNLLMAPPRCCCG